METLNLSLFWVFVTSWNKAHLWSFTVTCSVSFVCCLQALFLPSSPESLHHGCMGTHSARCCPAPWSSSLWTTWICAAFISNSHCLLSWWFNLLILMLIPDEQHIHLASYCIIQHMSMPICGLANTRNSLLPHRNISTVGLQAGRFIITSIIWACSSETIRSIALKRVGHETEYWSSHCWSYPVLSCDFFFSFRSAFYLLNCFFVCLFICFYQPAIHHLMSE